MKWLKTFVGGILAGISIAIGGTVFLSLDNKVLGALFFTVGLFAVCTFGFNLYTGKVCYVFDNDREYAACDLARKPLRRLPDGRGGTGDEDRSGACGKGGGALQREARRRAGEHISAVGVLQCADLAGGGRL